MPSPAAGLVALLRRRAAGPCADADLLHAFAKHGDVAAFRQIVARHGPMVLGLCRRALGDAHAADDAFQAAFLVLARKAASVRRPEALAAWLCGVARRVCGKARLARARRRAAESRTPPRPPAADPAAELTARELLAALDDELARLPANERLPLALVFWQGLPQAEAAGRLGLSLATLRGRLDRGRKRLAGRMRRRGFGPDQSGPVLLLAPVTSAAVPNDLLARTAALATEPWSKALPVAVAALAATSPKLVPAALLLVTVAGIGLIGLAVGSPQAASPPQPDVPPPAAAPGPRVDHFGDPLPAGAVLRLGMTAFKAPDVADIAFRADGDLVALDRNLNLFAWPPGQTTPRKLLTIPHATQPFHPCLSRDGRFVAAEGNKTITVWDVTGERPVEVLSRATNNAIRVFLSADGAWLAASERTANQGTLLLGHLPTKEWQTFPLPGGPFESASFSADGKRLAVAGVSGRTVLVIDTADGCEVMRVSPNNLQPYWAALNPSGDTLAVLPIPFLKRNLPPVAFLSVPSGEPAAGLTRPPSGLFRWVDFSSDGKTLLLGGRNGIRVWDAIKGGEVRTMPGSADFPPVFAPDGRRVASHSGSAVLLWDVATGRPVRRDLFDAGHHDAIMGVAVSPDGRWIATNSLDSEVIVWAANTGLPLWRIPSSSMGGGPRVVFTPDSGSVILVADDYVTPVLCDAATGRVVRRFTVPPERVDAETTRSLRLSADGKVLTTDAEPRTVGKPAFTVRWDANTGRELGRTERAWNPGPLRQPPSYSPDGQWSAENGRLALIGSGESIPLVPQDEAVLSRPPARFSEDSRLVAQVRTWHAGGRSDPFRVSVVVFDIAARASVELPTGPVVGLAFSPDDRTLAVAGEADIALWELPTGQRLQQLGSGGLAARPLAVVFTSDGRRLVTGHGDCTALVWDLTSLGDAAKPAPTASSADLAGWWAALAADDPAAAHRALWALAGRPAQAVPFLRERLKPVVVSADELATLVKRLDAPRFADRAAAERDLRRLGDAAVPTLRAALQSGPSAEQRQRIEAIVKAAEDPTAGEPLRTVRALAVLEWAAMADAQALLKDLAAGPAELRLTREAAAALQRLERRPP